MKIETITFHLIKTEFGLMLGYDKNFPILVKDIEEALEFVKNTYLERTQNEN